MQAHSRDKAWKKWLFGGSLIATGLATPAVQAQTLEFIGSTAHAHTTGGGADSFSGAGTWHVESHFSSFGYGDAEAWGTPSSLGLYAYGTTDTGGLSADASILSRFMVTSDAHATVDFAIINYGQFGSGSLSITDLTNDEVLLATEDGEGSQVVQLIAGRMYEYSSSATWGSTALTIPEPGCAADFNGDDTVNTQDVLAFLNAWVVQDGSADINGDGTVNTQDVLAFLNLWVAGC